jgi:hypothetical protein
MVWIGAQKYGPTYTDGPILPYRLQLRRRVLARLLRSPAGAYDIFVEDKSLRYATIHGILKDFERQKLVERESPAKEGLRIPFRLTVWTREALEAHVERYLNLRNLAIWVGTTKFQRKERIIGLSFLQSALLRSIYVDSRFIFEFSVWHDSPNPYLLNYAVTDYLKAGELLLAKFLKKHDIGIDEWDAVQACIDDILAGFLDSRPIHSRQTFLKSEYAWGMRLEWLSNVLQDSEDGRKTEDVAAILMKPFDEVMRELDELSE